MEKIKVVCRNTTKRAQLELQSFNGKPVKGYFEGTWTHLAWSLTISVAFITDQELPWCLARINNESWSLLCSFSLWTNLHWVTDHNACVKEVSSKDVDSDIWLNVFRSEGQECFDFSEVLCLPSAISWTWTKACGEVASVVIQKFKHRKTVLISYGLEI